MSVDTDEMSHILIDTKRIIAQPHKLLQVQEVLTIIIEEFF